jgi:hypothetical protein
MRMGMSWLIGRNHNGNTTDQTPFSWLMAGKQSGKSCPVGMNGPPRGGGVSENIHFFQ